MQEILKQIKEFTNISHYKMVERFVNACKKDNIDNISEWDIKIINKFYPELTNHAELSGNLHNKIQEKLTFVKESV